MSNEISIVEKAAQNFIEATGNYIAASKQLVSDMAEMDEEKRQETVDVIVSSVPAIRDWVERMAACASRGLIESSHLYDHTRLVTPTQIVRATPKAIVQIKDPAHEFEVVADEGTVYLRTAKDMNCRELSKCWDSISGRIDAGKQREIIRKRQKHVVSPNGNKVTVKSAGLTDEEGKQYIDMILNDGNQDISIAIPVNQLRKILK